MNIFTDNGKTHTTAETGLLYRMFEQQVKLTPDAVAVNAGEVNLTYHELDMKARALAEAIINFTPASVAVGVSTNRCIETIISVIAILKAGKAYLPIDLTYPAGRLDQIIADSGIDTCLAAAAEKPLFRALNINVLASDEAYSPSANAIETVNTDIAYVLYTSGSTGMPKGVMMGNGALVNLLLWQKENSVSAKGTNTLQFAPLGFDVSFQEIFATLTTGGTLVLIDEELRADPLRLLTFIHQNTINRIFLPFVVLQYLTEAAIANNYVPACLQEVITAGEQLKITPQITAFFKALPNCVLYNQYGPTETHVVTQLKLGTNADEWPALPSIGVPVSQTEIFILNEELQQVPQGETGELCVAGICLANGYLNNPALTAGKFLDWQPAGGEARRIYRTGDLARYKEDGNIEYLGRKDTQVKIRGNRVEIGEIEVLLNQLDGVQQAVVAAREDKNGIKRLVAYLVSSNGKQDGSRLRTKIEERLPEYMVPSAFVWLTELPKTTSGKVDRNALPAPGMKRPDLATTYRTPVTTTQKRLAALWADYLQLNDIGIDDNFFELGGNSLLGLKTVSALKQQHNYTLPVTKLYQYPTIAGIAVYLDGGTSKHMTVSPKLKAAPGSGDIAVVGMAGRFPGANTIDELWRILAEGKETIRFFKDDELDPNISPAVRNAPNYVKARGIIDRADEFDPAFFGLSPKVAELMDPQQRIFLEIAWEALESSGHLPSAYKGLVGVFAGCGSNTYYINNVISNHDKINNVGSFLVSTLNEKDYIASRTAYELNLKGPAISIHSACSTSLLAVAEAVESIRNGQCSVALAGGASITSPVYSGHLYEQDTMLSADGHCRSFDAEADGTVFSDGAGVVVLKGLEDALNEGDTIYAVIKGIGLNNDGGGKGSFTAPNAAGQAGAIAMAIQDAGVSAADISYVEAHGTATVLGDPIEIEGLTMAFGQQLKNQYCAIGSVKSNMGHLTAAAGVAGLIKTVLALNNKKIPPSLFYKNANPNINFSESPFYVNTKLTHWDADKRIAGVSSFGVGGTNVHVLLQEHLPQTMQPVENNGPYLISWSAKTEGSALLYRAHLQTYLENNNETALADIACTLQTTRTDFNERCFAIAADRQDLITQLASPTNKLSYKKLSVKASEVAFIFPGQGSQYVNMGRELYGREPVFANAVNNCAQLLRGTTQENILSVIFTDDTSPAADEALRDTLYTQPALFMISYAMAKLWMSWGIEPAVLLGHSIGEFVAAHLAGIFSLPDAIKLIAERARMVSLTPKGQMVSVRLSEHELTELLPHTLSIAVVNGKQAVVTAGPAADVDKLVAVLNGKQIANRVLQTSHAFHSAMMDTVVGPFEAIVRTIKLNPPVKPVISTITGKWMSEAEATDPKYWAEHLRSTVRFADAASLLLEDTNRIILEVGPGNTLANLVRQQAAGKPVSVIVGIEQPKQTSAYHQILKALGQLWLNGAEPDWKGFYKGQNRKRINNLPAYAFNRKRLWVDPVKDNYTAHKVLEAPRETLIDHLQETQKIMPGRRDQLTKKLKEIFEDASGIVIEDADVSFIELGFDSLLLTQVATNLKKEFNVPVTFRKLVEDYNTLQLLSIHLDEHLPADQYQHNGAATAGLNGHVPYAPMVNHDTGAQALNLITHQLQLLASQVASMQHGNIQQHMPVHTGHPINSLSAGATKAMQQPELTPEEQIEIKKPFGATARIEKQIKVLNDRQQAFLNDLVINYNQKTKGSKAYTQKHRPYMADPRVVSGFRPLTKEMVYPIVVNRSKGSRVWDIDGNEYIDALNGFGSNMLGYQPEFIKNALQEQMEKGFEIGPQHELAGEVCGLLCEFTSFDRAALCSTGSEGVLGAMRIARTVTGRSLIVAFSGSYHGIIDEVLVRGTKKLRSIPAAPGIMPEAVQNMLILDYGTDESLKIIEERAHEIAAVLVEVVQSRRPEYLPVEFLNKLRNITAKADTALIFDEVITGFRMHPGGMQAMLGIRADIGTYGKVIGGGMPIGVIAGKKEYMDALDGGNWQYGDASLPEAGVTYFAGTFVRHPLVLAAAKASLLYMKEKGPALQRSLTDKTTRLAKALNIICEKYKTPMYIASFGSLWKLKYKEEYTYSELLFTSLRLKGIHIMDGFPCFITDAHTEEDINMIISKFDESIAELIAAGMIPVPAIKEQDPPLPNGSHFSAPPVEGAKLGRDREGNPGWFIEDNDHPGKYLQVVLNK